MYTYTHRHFVFLQILGHRFSDTHFDVCVVVYKHTHKCVCIYKEIRTKRLVKTKVVRRYENGHERRGVGGTGDSESQDE